MTIGHVVFCGLLARATGLHAPAVQAIESDNPTAAFTLIRAYAENAAAILYAKDHPHVIGAWSVNDGHGVSVGKITNYASSPKGRFGAFKPIYKQLSEMAHPASRSVLSSSRITPDGRYEWLSTPSFKTESDALIACGWVVELTEATSHLLVEFGESDIVTSSHPFAQRR